MRPPYSKQDHNITSFSIGKAIVCRTNWLIQKQLTLYIGKLVIPVGKLNLEQSLKHKDFQISKLVFQILSFKSYPKLSFCGLAYCMEVS